MSLFTFENCFDNLDTYSTFARVKPRKNISSGYLVAPRDREREREIIFQVQHSKYAVVTSKKKI